jgi:hypothetical protein
MTENALTGILSSKPDGKWEVEEIEIHALMLYK